MVFYKKCNIKNSPHFSEIFIKSLFLSVLSPLKHEKIPKNGSKTHFRVGTGFILAAAKFEPIALNLHFWLMTRYPSIWPIVGSAGIAFFRKRGG